MLREIMDDQIVTFIDGLKSNPQIVSLDESSIKQTIVMRLLFLLGWDIFNVDEVNSNYKAKNHPIDYSLRLKSSNKIFINVRKMGKALDKSQQLLLESASKEGVEFTIFTNGLLWWFYLMIDKENWEQKNFCSLDFLNQKADDITDQLENFLARAPVSSGKALALAENILKKRHQKLIEETIPAAWTKILSEPSDALVNLLIETTEKICGYPAERDAAVKFLSEGLNRWQYSNISTTQKPLSPEPAKESEPAKKPEPESAKEPEPAKKPEPEPAKEPEPEKEIEPAKASKPQKAAEPVKAPVHTAAEQSISFFTFRKKVYHVNSGSDMIVRLCKILQTEHKKDIKSLLWHSIGDKYYFSKDVNEVRFPEEIGSTGIFFQSNMTPNQAVKVAYSIVSFFGYSEDDFSVSSENK
jgi:predicted type IV restriction endonuclease